MIIWKKKQVNKAPLIPQYLCDYLFVKYWKNIETFFRAAALLDNVIAVPVFFFSVQREQIMDPLWVIKKESNRCVWWWITNSYLMYIPSNKPIYWIAYCNQPRSYGTFTLCLLRLFEEFLVCVFKFLKRCLFIVEILQMLKLRIGIFFKVNI